MEAAHLQEIVAAARSRQQREAAMRPRYVAGELSLDAGNLREVLAGLGVTYW